MGDYIWYHGRSYLVTIHGSLTSLVYSQVLQLGLAPYLHRLRRYKMGHLHIGDLLLFNGLIIIM
jgi:hypothetical protein